ncbi:MAG: autotransporter-associated beta strand repeat-containing protein, partial [Sulfuricellaceae bacterium]|nr:autotransporter-associated beta strand repeat-containing protein [Sulfuricellaceae bacterium]
GGAGNTAIGGVIGTTSGTLTKDGGGTLILSGANTYTGATSINEGTLQLGAANRIADTSAITVASGATFNLNGFADTVGSIAGDGNITLGSATLTSGGDNSTTAFSGVIGGSGGLTKSGSGSLTLSGSNTYTGVTTLSAGTLSVGTIGNGGAAGNLGAATNAAANLVLGGGTLQYTGADASTNRNFTLTAGTTSTFDVTANNLTISGASTNTTGALTKAGSGTLTLAGANLYTGLTTVNAGTLAYGAANALSSGALTVNGGTLDIGAYSDTVGAVTLGSGSINGTSGVLTGTSYAVQSGSIGAILGGTAALTKTTAGTVTLSGANTYTGVTTISAGTLSVGTIGNGGVAGNLGAATSAAANLVLSGGSLQYTGADASTNRNFTLTAGTTSTLDVSANNLTLSGASTNTTGALTKAGSGTLTLAGANLYTGLTTVSAGKLVAANAAALGSTAGGTTVANGASLGIANVAIGNEAVTLNGAGVGGTGALSGTGTASLSGAVSIASDSTVGGSGSLTLGALNIADGATLTLGTGSALNLTTGSVNGTALGAASNLTVNTLGSLNLGNTGTDLGAVNITASGSTLNDITATTIAITDSSAGGVILNSGAVLSATATSNADALRIVTDKFVNNSGSGAGTLITGAGSRWLVYSANPASDTRGTGLTAAFKQYNASYGSTVLGSGNGFLYSLAPIVTPSLTGAVSKTYDGNDTATLTAANYTFTGGVDGDTVTLNNPSSGTYGNKNAGTGKAVSVGGISASASNGATTVYGYQVANGGNASGNIGAITAKALTLSATVADKTYDGNRDANVTGYGLIGLVSGETLGASSTGALFDTKNAGTGKTVYISGIALADGTGLASNYSLSSTATATANITPANLAVTGVSAANKVYDGTTAATLGGTAAIAVFGSDIVSLGGTGSGLFADKNVGNGKAVTVSGYSISGADAGNYALIQPAGLTANITARPLAITATGVGKVYDGTTAATVTFSDNRISGDLLNLSGTASYLDKNAGTGKTVNVSAIGATGADAGNYSFATTASTTANITPANLAVTGLSAANKVYDGSTAAILGGTATIAVFGSDDVHLGGSGSAAFADKNVGNGKAVTLGGYSISGADAGNYSLIQPAGLTAAITARPLAITATGVGKVYDGSTAATVSYADNRIAGDLLTLAGTASYLDKNAGTGKTVNVSAIGATGSDAGNYSFATTASTTADITPRPLAIAATGVGKVYDGSTAATVTYADNRIAGDLLTLAGTASYLDKNAGTGKTVNVSAIGATGTDAGNYSFATTASTTADISPANLAVTGVTAANKVYDGTTAATLSGMAAITVFGSDDVHLSGTGSAAFADKNVGNGKTVTVGSYSISGADAGNYSLIQPSGLTANISPANLAITGVSAANKVYDGTTAAILDGTAAITVFGSDDVHLSGTGSAAFADKNVGNGKTVTLGGYSISGADAGNYALIQPAGLTANITARPLAITATGVGKVYDGTTAATVTDADNRIAGDLLTLAGTASYLDKNAGTGKIVNVSAIGATGADAGNYSFATTATASADITPRPLTIAANGATKIYDGIAYFGGNGVTYTGFANNETPADLGGTLTYGGNSQGAIYAGNYLIIPSGLASGNYTIAYVDGVLRINPLPITPATAGIQPDVAEAVVTLPGGVKLLPVLQAAMTVAAAPINRALAPSGILGAAKPLTAGVSVQNHDTVEQVGGLTLINGGVKLPDNTNKSDEE